MTSWLLLVTILSQPEGSTGTEDIPDIRSEPSDALQIIGGLDLVGFALGLDGDSPAGFLQVTPVLALDGGHLFQLSIGAPLRFQVFGEDSVALRREDWDELSDLGQLLDFFSMETSGAELSLSAGAISNYILCSGHLVSRYTNRGNFNYHPAGLRAAATAGPLSIEAFASDLLAARLFAGEVSLAPLRLLGMPDGERIHLSVSVAHDFGRSGQPSPPVTLAHADLSIMLGGDAHYSAYVFLGAGTRLLEPETPYGGVAGAALHIEQDSLRVRGRLEVRRHSGGFREGFFGPDYELSRLVGPNSGVPLAEERLPNSFSAMAEARVAWDPSSLKWGPDTLALDVGVEAFTWGRLDVDVRLLLNLLPLRQLGLTFRAAGAGLLQPGARYSFSSGVRYRFRGVPLYLAILGGREILSQRGPTLVPATFASAGVGGDHVW
jgi:hypothetical protein